MTQHVKTEVTAGIMTITLARAEKKNALSNAMYSAMSDGLERIRHVCVGGAARCIRRIGLRSG